MMAKRFARGLVVGKFCPLHLGHMLLIDTALAACEEVFVLSYTLPAFDGCGKAVREGWLRSLYPQVRALVLEDGIPDNSAPDAQQCDFVAWVCRTYWHTDVDAVFSSEDYGDGFAAALSSHFGRLVQHVCVDRARTLVPISGTAIRNDPGAARAFLAPVVYASFVKRVAVLGGESSGKTSIAAGLAALLGTVWAPEYGRERWVEKSGALAYDDMLHIAQVQVAREDAMAQQAHRVLVCDTSPLTTLCYSLDLFGCANAQLEQLATRAYDTILLCAPDFPFVQDGTRRDTDFRARQHNWYRNVLDRHQIPYTMLAGPLEQRLQHAISHFL